MSGRRQWSDAEVNRETVAAVGALAKAANCTVTSIEIAYVTPAERAEALAKDFYYRQMAGRVVDQAEAAAYRALAAAELKKAGI